MPHTLKKLLFVLISVSICSAPSGCKKESSLDFVVGPEDLTIAIPEVEPEEQYRLLKERIAKHGETPDLRRELKRLEAEIRELKNRRESDACIREARKEKDLAKALELCEKSVEIDPGYAESHVALGEMRFKVAQLRRREGKLEEFSSLLSLGKGSLEEAMKLDGANQRGYFFLAEILSQLNAKTLELKANYNRAFMCDKNTWLGMLANGRLRELEGRTDLAIKAFSDALRKKADLEAAFLARAELYRRARDYKKAVSDVASVLKNTANNADAFVLRAYIRYDQEDWVGSREDIQKAIVLDKGNAKALALLAHLKLREGDREGALKDGEAAHKINSFCADAARVRGMIDVTAKRPNLSSAESNLFTACELQSFNDENHYWYGRVMESSNKLTDALRAYSKCLQLNKKNRRALLNRAKCHRLLFDYDSALQDVEQALALQPKNGMVYLERSKIRSGRLRKNGIDYKLAPWNEVLSDLNSAIRHQPNLAAAYGQRAFIYRSRGQLKEALNDYNLAIQGKPEDVYVLHGYRGLIYARLNEYNKAISDFEKFRNSAEMSHPIYSRIDKEYSRVRRELDKKK